MDADKLINEAYEKYAGQEFDGNDAGAFDFAAGFKAALTARRSDSAQAPLTAIALLAENHKGMRVDYSGLFKQARVVLTKGSKEPALAEMFRQLQDHITELGTRWYAGDTAVVDELLQLYCVEKGARDALVAAAPGAPAAPDSAPEDFEQMTPNQKRALSKGLAALETMADLWAAEVRLSQLALRLAAVPNDSERAGRIAAMIQQGFIEGAYRHFLDHKDSVAPAAVAATYKGYGECEVLMSQDAAAQPDERVAKLYRFLEAPEHILGGDEIWSQRNSEWHTVSPEFIDTQYSDWIPPIRRAAAPQTTLKGDQLRVLTKKRIAEIAAEFYDTGDGDTEHGCLDVDGFADAIARATAPQAVSMPALTAAMRDVLRNENCVYGSEDALYDALCAAAQAPVKLDELTRI